MAFTLQEHITKRTLFQITKEFVESMLSFRGIERKGLHKHVNNLPPMHAFFEIVGSVKTNS